MRSPVALSALCRVFRSKNASPFLTTIDLFFHDAPQYQRARESSAVTASRIAERLRIPESYVIGIHWQETALGLKITVVKPTASGDPDNADVFGAQQYIPLLDLEIA